MTKTRGLSLITITLLVWLPAAGRGGAMAPAASDERLTVAFFTAGFLAEIAARIEAERLEAARLAGGYLQEDTGLIWSTSDNAADVDWYAAREYCRELEVADWSDWRMPSIEELEGLHQRRSASLYKVPSAIRLSGCCPWSQTLNGDASAWNFSFRYRKRFSGSLNYSFQLRALCVRPATEADVLFYEEAEAAAKELAKKKRRS